MKISTARVYDLPSAGYRVLVDRLWPRGIAKEKLSGVHWDKEVAPSTELREEFHGGDIDFDQFSKRYLGELQSSGAGHDLLDRAAHAGAEHVVLLYSGKDTKQNNALVLMHHLRGILSAQHTS